MLTKRVGITQFIFLLVIGKSYLLQTIYYIVFLVQSHNKLGWRMYTTRDIPPWYIRDSRITSIQELCLGSY